MVRNSAKGRGSEAVDKKGLEEREGGQVKIQSESCSVRGALAVLVGPLLFARGADGAEAPGLLDDLAEKSDGIQKNTRKGADILFYEHPSPSISLPSVHC